MELFYPGPENRIRLVSTSRNKAILKKITEGIYPGLVTLDGENGPFTINLSEGTPFLIMRTGWPD